MIYYSGSTPPPGHFIKGELDARGWAQSDLAYILSCPVQAVNMIVSGKPGISPEMAKALGQAFDVPAEFFANFQKRLISPRLAILILGSVAAHVFSRLSPFVK